MRRDGGGLFTGATLRAIRAFVAKRVRPDDVDDMMQEVALRMEQRHAAEPIANPDGYLFQVARNVVHDHARKDIVRQRGAHDSLEEHHHPVEELSPARVLESKERLAQVIAALNDLPERTRQAFVLHRFEEMSYSAIARHMGVSVSAVEKHIMRAMRLLAERCGE